MKEKKKKKKKNIEQPQHTYSNILEILPPKNENFQIKNLIFFIFLLKTEIVGTR